MEMKKPFMFDYDTGDLNCIICNKKYTTYNDPFLTIVDSKNLIEITYELCLNCIHSLKYCGKCNREYDQPWENVYLNISDNTHHGKCCFNKN